MPYQLRQHPDYLEVRLEGVLEVPLRLDRVAAQARGTVLRILLDYAAVTDVIADTYHLAQQARRGEDLGFKVAVYAPRPALFGINRQAVQLASVREGETVAVFKDLDEARAWLRSG